MANDVVLTCSADTTPVEERQGRSIPYEERVVLFRDFLSLKEYDCDRQMMVAWESALNIHFTCDEVKWIREIFDRQHGSWRYSKVEIAHGMSLTLSHREKLLREHLSYVPDIRDQEMVTKYYLVPEDLPYVRDPDHIRLYKGRHQTVDVPTRNGSPMSAEAVFAMRWKRGAYLFGGLEGIVGGFVFAVTYKSGIYTFDDAVDAGALAAAFVDFRSAARSARKGNQTAQSASGGGKYVDAYGAIQWLETKKARADADRSTHDHWRREVAMAVLPPSVKMSIDDQPMNVAGKLLIKGTGGGEAGSEPPRRKYTPSPKRDATVRSGRQGTPMDLTAAEAEKLLNDPDDARHLPGKRQFLGIKNGKIYAFQDDNTGGYHGYPISGQEVTQKYPQLQKWVADKLGTTVKRLSQMP